MRRLQVLPRVGHFAQVPQGAGYLLVFHPSYDKSLLEDIG